MGFRQEQLVVWAKPRREGRSPASVGGKGAALLEKDQGPAASRF